MGHPLMAEAYPLSVLSEDGHWRAILDEDFKFVWNNKGKHQLFDLNDDPREERNLVLEAPETTKRMNAHLRERGEKFSHKDACYG